MPIADPLQAVFLDRDGVINRKAPEGDYITSWERFEFLPGALDALRDLAAAGVPVIVISNQRGIALERMTSAALTDIHRRMVSAVQTHGGRIDAIYHCPHDNGCPSRKPNPGMLLRAADDHGLDLAHTVLIGDQPSDMLAADRAAAGRVLVGAARGQSAPDHVAPDLGQAVRWVLDAAGRTGAPAPARPALSGPVVDLAC